MLEDIDLLKHIDSIHFSHVDSKNNNLNLDKKSTYKNFMCKTFRITSDTETRSTDDILDTMSEESLTSYETIKENDEFFFCLNVVFKEHSSYKLFETKFTDFFEYSHKAYLFWVHAKVMYNEKLSEQKTSEIEKLLQEIVDVQFFVNKSLSRQQ